MSGWAWVVYFGWFALVLAVSIAVQTYTDRRDRP